MKILYFSYVDLDTPSACQTHTLGIIGGFAANGCQVDAIVPRPSCPPRPCSGVRFHFISSYHGGRSFFLREVPYSTFLLWSLSRHGRYDAIYARDMDVFIGPRLCSQLFGIPLYLEVNDSPLSGCYPALVKRLVKISLGMDYRRAAGFIVPSVPRAEMIHRDYGIPRPKIQVILNGTEELDLSGIPTKAEAKKRLGLPADSFCLGYLGTIWPRYDFGAMLAAMVKCLDRIPHLYFIMVGSGSGMDRVKEQAAALGLTDRLVLTGYLPEAAYARVLPAMDVGLMSLTPAAVLEHGPIHTKMATYASFNLPSITAGYSLEGYPAEVRRGVVLVPPGDPDALAAAILRLHQNPAEAARRARNLHHFVMNRLTWKAVAADILRIMEKSWKPPTAK
ncbi:MAG: glycosyltransferase [Syntrophobacterales bacterium]|jgi:glycosyltransferase involved in cell wall biosynthesis|nr:glycosyltransferase [Syntrophobacterales bacterium]